MAPVDLAVADVRRGTAHNARKRRERTGERQRQDEREQESPPPLLPPSAHARTIASTSWPDHPQRRREARLLLRPWYQSLGYIEAQPMLLSQHRLAGAKRRLVVCELVMPNLLGDPAPATCCSSRSCTTTRGLPCPRCHSSGSESLEFAQAGWVHARLERRAARTEAPAPVPSIDPPTTPGLVFPVVNWVVNTARS